MPHAPDSIVSARGVYNIMNINKYEDTSNYMFNEKINVTNYFNEKVK